jgi:four helix bundle protein
VKHQCRNREFPWLQPELRGFPAVSRWGCGIRGAEQRRMDLPDLRPRTHRFAIDSIAFVRRLPNTSEAQVAGLQYLRSATGVNSNYRAARRGRSRKEFISKLGNVVEEADESVEWLEVMRDSRIAHDSRLLGEAKELLAIFTASLKTARKNGQ